MNTTITCYDRDGRLLDDGLVQWDVNVTIQVSGADTSSAPAFHFCQKGRDFAYVVPSTVKGDKLEVAVPNILLQSYYPLIVFIYYADISGEHRSKYQLRIPITPREQPMEYVYVENIGYEDWVEIASEAKRLVDANEALDANIKRSGEILSQMDEDVRAAQTAERNSAMHEDGARSAAADAQASRQAAKVSEDAAKASQDASKGSEVASQASQMAAANSELAAKNSEIAAQQSATASKDSQDAAELARDDAKASQDAASVSAAAAAKSASDGKKYATAAQSYAGGNTGSREGEEVDNARFYYDQAKRIAQGLAGALLPMGTVSFEELPLMTKQAGYMYNISNAFTTDETFREGAGHSYPAGTNVYYTVEGEWDCLAGAQVVSVNGQTGAVVITPTSIGALTVHEWEMQGRDYNTLVETGIYQIQGVSPNAPPFTPMAGYPEQESHFHILVFENWENWIRQIAFDVRSSKVWTRDRRDGIWYPWIELVNSSELAIRDSELDWAVMEGHTPSGNMGGLYWNKGKFLYVGCRDERGEEQWAGQLYGEMNPPPYPVSSVSGQTGNVLAPILTDSEADWGIMSGSPPSGNRISFGFNKGERCVYAAATDNQGVMQWNQALYGTEHKPTPNDIGAVAKTGDTMTGGLSMAGPLVVGNKVSMRADGEGGNIDITPPDGFPNYWEIDAHDGNLRFISFAPGVEGVPLVLNRNPAESVFAGASALAERVRSPITFTGGATGSYDGSAPLAVKIPSTAEEVGALPTSGGTLTGDLWVANGAAGLFYAPGTGGRLCLVPSPGFGIRDWNIDGYEGVLRFFATRADGSFFFPLFISEAATSVNNTLVVGNKVSLRADNEGGNISITPPDGFPNYWEIDAYDGNLRVLNFDPNVPGSVSTPLILNQNPAESVFYGKLMGGLNAVSDGVWRLGERHTCTVQLPLSGIVSSGTQSILIYFPTGKPIAIGTHPVIEVLRGTLRGPDGYIDNNSDQIEFVSDPNYTVSTVQDPDLGIIRITIRKNTPFTNVSNNVPVNLLTTELTFRFDQYTGDEPMPGPEIFADDAGMEGPSVEGNVGQTYAPADAENAESASSEKSDAENEQTERIEPEQAETERTEAEQAETDTVTDDADEAVPEAEETEDEA